MSDILVRISRGKIVENIIRGDLVVMDKQSSIVAKVGDPYKVTYVRSAIKPIQTSVILEQGIAERYGINDGEIAVMCSSHNAEDFHIRAVSSILEKIGLDESYLLCGAEYSLNPKIAERYIREGQPRRAINNNCSGKHACMLAIAMMEAADLSGYTKLKHPVQQKILQTVAAYCGMKPEDIIIGLDGCGVPVFGMPLYNMALSYINLGNPDLLERPRGDAVRRITQALAAYPLMIAGTGEFCSRLIEVTKGRIIGKKGADGIFCATLVNGGLALAVKLEDGNMLGLAPVVMSILKQLELVTKEESDRLAHFYIRDNINCQYDKVGEVRPVFDLEIH
ncbi:MAG: asparaginase [Clostridiales bacterium]|jgi:L-asparaginase II|nr:asparaginase [Clostridiales bacterium]